MHFTLIISVMHSAVRICVKQFYDGLPDPRGGAGTGTVGRAAEGDFGKGAKEGVHHDSLPE